MAVEVSRIDQRRDTAHAVRKAFTDPVEFVRHGAPELAELIIRAAKELWLAIFERRRRGLSVFRRQAFRTSPQCRQCRR
jgi:hypothetical protein